MTDGVADHLLTLDKVDTLVLMPRVYFITAAEVARFKIGFTSELNTRLRAMQTGSPCLLHVVHSAPGNIALERRCHQAARSLGYLHAGGEWFDGHVDQIACEEIVRAAGGPIDDGDVWVEQMLAELDALE